MTQRYKLTTVGISRKCYIEDVKTGEFVYAVLGKNEQRCINRARALVDLLNRVYMLIDI